MAQPVYVPRAPAATYQNHQFVVQPGHRPVVSPSAVPQMAPTPGATANQPGMLAPVVRAQTPDEATPQAAPAPADIPSPPLRMPSPEELGLASANVQAEVVPDWAAVHRKLNELGAQCVQLERLPQSGWRFTCLLPGSRPEQAHRIESHAGTQAEAVQLVLAKVEGRAGRQ